MTCAVCHCPAGTPVVTLADGSLVSSWCRRWLDECRDRYAAQQDVLREAVAIMAMACRDDRVSALARIRARRGDTFAQAVEAKVRELWAAQS